MRRELTLTVHLLHAICRQMTLGQAFTLTGSETGAIIIPILQAGKLRFGKLPQVTQLGSGRSKTLN